MATNNIKETSELMPERGPAPSREEMLDHLRLCMTVQKRAMSFGKRPFGACLVGPDGTVLLTHQSIDVVNHAEASLSRLAVTHYSLPFLWQCTLYSTWEPCAMCAFTIYWANIGRVVFGASNETLMALTGGDNPQNLGIDLGMREALGRGKKAVEVEGPFGEVEGEVREMSRAYF